MMRILVLNGLNNNVTELVGDSRYLWPKNYTFYHFDNSDLVHRINPFKTPTTQNSQTHSSNSLAVSLKG